MSSTTLSMLYARLLSILPGESMSANTQDYLKLESYWDSYRNNPDFSIGEMDEYFSLQAVICQKICQAYLEKIKVEKAQSAPETTTQVQNLIDVYSNVLLYPGAKSFAVALQQPEKAASFA